EARLHRTALGARGASAVDVGLGAVLHGVRAGPVRADATFADSRHAVAAEAALGPNGARIARPAAIPVGLRAVLHRVGARRHLANARLAHAGSAVRCRFATLPVRARRAGGAAAVDVRLVSAEDAVDAQRVLALVIGAE